MLRLFVIALELIFQRPRAALVALTLFLGIVVVLSCFGPHYDIRVWR